MKRIIFHVDVNSAFLSWEAVSRLADGEEDLRLIPSVVSGNPENRSSIITAKSIPAKAYGIQTGEPLSMAMRKCPGLVAVKPDFHKYEHYSREFKRICRDYTSTMESFSIDEVFLDMTEMGIIFPDPIKTAHELKDRIYSELGFTVNVGIGTNKLCAKMASDFEKPNKVHTLFDDEVEKKLWPLPVRELFMIGKSSAGKLTDYGIVTIGDLARLKPETAISLLGDKMGNYAINAAKGIDETPVNGEEQEAKGFSTETTLEEDVADINKINRILMSLADVVAARMRKEGAKCGCVAVSYKTSDFTHKSHQKKLRDGTDITGVIYETACLLFREFWQGEPIRLIGIALTDIDRDGFEQLSFIQDEKKEKLKKLDTALTQIRDRYGNTSIRRAGTIDNEERIGRRHKENRKEGRKEGMSQGKIDTLISLVEDEILSLTEAAKRAGVNEMEFLEMMDKRKSVK